MERWKDIKGFPGYQVSDQGRVRTFWRRKHYPTGYGSYNYLSDTPRMMSQSDDGNGYMKLMLYCKTDGKRYCKKVHRLVAEAFVKHSSEDDTVDHIRSGPEGKLDNSVQNLRWVPRAENIKKAYRDGMCDRRIERQCRDITAIDIRTGEECYFRSIKEAAEMLRLKQSTISHALSNGTNKVSHYRFEYAVGEDRLLYGSDDDQLLSWLRVGVL